VNARKSQGDPERIRGQPALEPNGSVFFGKMDTTKIASMGHSAGSLASFGIANDPRLTTTMHLDGGTMDPHTDAKTSRSPRRSSAATTVGTV
jgi:hypothetical protein